MCIAAPKSVQRLGQGFLQHAEGMIGGFGPQLGSPAARFAVGTWGMALKVSVHEIFQGGGVGQRLE